MNEEIPQSTLQNAQLTNLSQFNAIIQILSLNTYYSSSHVFSCELEIGAQNVSREVDFFLACFMFYAN